MNLQDSKFPLMAQHNFGVFTLAERPVFFLLTTQQSLSIKRTTVKNKLLDVKAYMNILIKRLNQQQSLLEHLAKIYRTTDRKLALIDGRFKQCRPKTEFNKPGKQTSGKLGILIKTPNNKQLREALNLMSKADRNELLKELLN